MQKKIALLLAITMLSTSFTTYAAKTSDLQLQINQNASSIKKNQNELNKIQNEKKDVLEEIEDLNQDIRASQAELDELQGQIDSLNAEINDKENEIKEGEQLLENKNKLLQKRIKAMYENGEESYFEILLDSENMVDFLKRYDLMNRMVESDKNLFNEITAKHKSIEEIKVALESSKNVREMAKKQEQEKNNALNSKKSKKDNYIKELDKDAKKLEKLIDQELAESRALEAQIKALQGGGSGSTVNYSNTQFLWPSAASKRITSKYGNRLHPVLKVYKLHTGIDIGAGSGTNILASNSGKVIKAQYNSAYGNMIIIDHGGGMSTLYAHASKLLVSVGQTVNRGDVIAKVGSTGYSTGPHLHFEVRKNGSPVDPMPYIS